MQSLFAECNMFFPFNAQRGGMLAGADTSRANGLLDWNVPSPKSPPFRRRAGVSQRWDAQKEVVSKPVSDRRRSHSRSRHDGVFQVSYVISQKLRRRFMRIKSSASAGGLSIVPHTPADEVAIGEYIASEIRQAGLQSRP